LTLEVDNEPKGGPANLGDYYHETPLRAKVFSWLPAADIESAAFEQILNIAALPNAVAVAVMPDAHKGYGMPIGTALATMGYWQGRRDEAGRNLMFATPSEH